ncbi:hypothetical protein ACOSQ2_032101 [Xanthoceras sorbifolium]
MAGLRSSSYGNNNTDSSVINQVQSSSFPSHRNFNLPLKFDQENYVLWKSQVLPAIRAYDLEDFILGESTSPPKFVETRNEEFGEVTQTVNIDFLQWKKIDYERDLLLSVLQGLGNEYDACIVTITALQSTITVQDAQLLLMSYEARLDQQTSSASLTLSSASTNFVQSGNGRGQQSYNRERRGRGKGNGRGRGTMCQLCGRVGHYSAIYYHRFDQNFQGNRPNPTQTGGYQGQGRGTNAGNTIQGHLMGDIKDTPACNIAQTVQTVSCNTSSHRYTNIDSVATQIAFLTKVFFLDFLFLIISSSSISTQNQSGNQAFSSLFNSQLNFNLPIKLDRENYPLWKAQVLPAIRAYNLEEYIFESKIAPELEGVHYSISKLKFSKRRSRRRKNRPDRSSNEPPRAAGSLLPGSELTHRVQAESAESAELEVSPAELEPS